MAPKRRVPLSTPTFEPLPHNLRLPSDNPDVFKTLSRLSRSSLLSLAVQWCQDENLQSCGPYIDNAEEQSLDAAYETAQSLEEVVEIYEEELPKRKGTKREVVERILEGDWRHGISLKQLAMAEMRFILEHPNALRWTAFRFERLGASDAEAEKDFKLLRFHSQTFLLELQREIAPMTKSHYYIDRPKSHPITLVRIHLHDTPYNTQRSFSDTRVPSLEPPKTIFVAFPDATPFVYVAVTSGGNQIVSSESKSLQRFVINAIPKAMSKPEERYELRGTSLTARSLDSLLALRGNGRTNASAGGWSIFADDTVGKKTLEFRQPFSPTPEPEAEKENVPQSSGLKRPFQHLNPTANLDTKQRKRLKKIAKGRFGSYGDAQDEVGLQRFDVKIEDPFLSQPRPSTFIPNAITERSAGREEGDRGEWTPNIRLSFQGTHVFAGIRALVEKGVLNGERLPGWMTGEGGVSVGTIKDGRITTAGAVDGL